MSGMGGEERLRPELDGRGGGFGKFRGLTVRELSEQFARIADDGNMRAFSAILRISREQLEARGHLGMYRWVAAAFGIVGVACAIAYPLSPERLHFALIRAAFVGIIGGALFGLAAGSTLRATRAAIAQERAIRDMAIDALLEIAHNPTFKPRALDYDQRRILDELLKRGKRNEPKLQEILRIEDAED